ncbi:MAG: acyltransferase [Eubacterium sp.]|nr:acyltransferase [Eubacterium sp.]
MEIKDVFSLKIRDIVSLIISLPITIYVNFRCLPFKTALKFPIFVGYKTHIDKLSRNIRFGCEPTTFMVRIGWGGTEGRELGKKNYLLLNENAMIQFNGRCTMSSGVSLILDLGTLEIGNDFFCNKNCTISCNDRITIGDNVLFGWNVEVLDSDNHKVIHKNKETACDHGTIKIGDHVWVAAFSHILKNSIVPDGSVVAYHSLVTKQFEGEKLLLGGCPAKVIEEQIEWKR